MINGSLPRFKTGVLVPMSECGGGEERALLRRRVNDGRIASSEYLKCSAVMPKASIAFPVFRDLTARVVKEVVRSGGGVWEHS